MRKTRLDPIDRRKQLLDVALTLAAKKGYTRITREEIAEHAQVSPALISNYFKTMVAMRRILMREAVRRSVGDVCLAIIGQGLASRDPHALKASDEVKRQAASALCS